MKRAVSLVSIRRQPNEPELRLPVSKRQLIASVSCEDLQLESKMFPSSNILKYVTLSDVIDQSETPRSFRSSNKSPVIFFWTPEYWYRPRSARDAYLELRNHLNKIMIYHNRRSKLKMKCEQMNDKTFSFSVI